MLIVILVSGLALTGLAGCAAPPAAAPETRIIAAAHNIAWQSCERVIHRYGFEPDVMHQGEGLIITQPQTSAQWFEMWRKDAPSGFALTESNLHTIRRYIRIDVAVEGVTQTRITCGVTVQRLHHVEDTPGGLRYAANIFSQGSSSSIPQRRNDSVKVEWVDLGYDALLQQQLLDEIDSHCRRMATK